MYSIKELKSYEYGCTFSKPCNLIANGKPIKKRDCDESRLFTTQKYTLEAIKTKRQNVKGALGRRAQGRNIKNSMCNRSIPSPFGIIFLRLYTISHKKAIFQALKIWKGFVVSPIYNQTNIFRKVKSVQKQNEVKSIFMLF